MTSGFHATTEPSPPVLDPDRWTKRHTTLVGVAIVVAAIASTLGSDGIWTAHGARTFVGAALGIGLILLAASLPGVSLLGLYVGLSVTTAATLAWTHPDKPRFVWAVQAVQIVVLSLWTFPWLRHRRTVWTLGTAWTGLSYWLLGIAGAVLTGLVESDRHYFGVGAQRVAYLMLVSVSILAVIKATSSPGRSVSVGLAAAFLVTLGVLFVLGSANVFESVHAAPNHSGARYLENRFWGGAGVFYHPVSMAGIAAAAALRVALDRMFRTWQRVATAAVAPLVIMLTQTRTAAVLVLAGAVIAIVLHVRSAPIGLRSTSQPIRVLAGLLALVVVAGASFALRGRVVEFFTVARYEDAPLAQRYGRADDVTSGRVATWKQVFREFRTDGWTEKLFGSAERSRATVLRPGDDPNDSVTVVTDNAAVGALRRGGVLGVGAFLFGLLLLLRHAVRSGSTWFAVAAIASLATVPTTDWLLGSPLWYLLLSAEVAVVLAAMPSAPISGESLPPERSAREPA